MTANDFIDVLEHPEIAGSIIPAAERTPVF
jgi:hypothetical protein